MSTQEILKQLKSGALKDNARDAVLAACGMTPIPRVSSRSELGRVLGTRFPTDQDALPELVEACL